MVNVAIVGGSGYTGVELLRILSGHPNVNVTAVTSRKTAGQALADVFPSLGGTAVGLDGLVFEEPDPTALKERAEFFFTAVPHKTAMEMVPFLLDGNGRVVDLSADFRFTNADVYSKWYVPHTAPDLLDESVYGLPELYRDRIASARLVGNPGCYPTSIILAAAPLLKNNLVDPDTLIADSKSGVSGAGREPSQTTHFCEANDGLMAYKVTGHRHTPEIEQELSLLAGKDLTVSFTPHLIPMSRGILSTVYGRLAKTISTDELFETFQAFYQGAPFVRIRRPGMLPHTLDVRGSNFCDLGVFVDDRTGLVKVVSVIDNLTRGASGQAVCCMNLMLGLEETTGLGQAGLRP
jgi:N-acetyl-gamma-glutamyl-phosphate reductase